jgi:hypothetical protein
MTSTTPLGCISKAEDKLKHMLAACSAFQSWIGANVDPLCRIHLVELPPPITDAMLTDTAPQEPDNNYALWDIVGQRPFALIWTPSDQPFSIDIIASPNLPNPSGVLRVRLEENVNAAYEKNYPEAYRRFLNTVGQIIHSEDSASPGLVELLAVCGADYLNFHHIEVVDHMRTTSDDVPTLGDAHKCELEIRWGANA